MRRKRARRKRWRIGSVVDLITILKVIEEEVGVGHGEDEVLHLLAQQVQVLLVLHVPGGR